LERAQAADGFPGLVPDTLHDLDTTGGWGYGQFNYETASDSFSPLGTGPGCGFACHTKSASKDYVITTFPKH